MSLASFRPIAPAMDVYAAACNPPRRAKRLRPDDTPSPLSEPDIADDDADDADRDDRDDHDDPPPLPPPKRRGRRPGTLSRAAREAQRKINHSLIEKARRTKINDALATLRDLVPPEYKRPAESHPDDSDDDDPKQRPRPKAPAEKEFKLEILVRTVAYLQDLTDRVKQLEHDGCPRCSEPISLAPGDARKRCSDPLDAATSPASSLSRLPSISAWLPEDQRSILRTPSQLPTPPTSATCIPTTTGFQIPPVLTLPSPRTFLPPPTAHIQPRFSGFTPRPKPAEAPSPLYTPDDETAASLLLRMSTTSPRTLSKLAPARPVEPDTNYALTPSRLLGLSAER